MKNTYLVPGLCIFLLLSVQRTNAQQLDSLQNQVMKLMKFYDSYKDGSPESLKKANYNDAVDEISGGTATQSDKDAAYKIIDAYIKGDKALEQNSEHDGNDNNFDEAVGNMDEVKEALRIMEEQQTRFMNMSYSEFESTILGANPVADKKEIKKAYNAMHKNDGKQVAITDADNEMTELQKQMWAIETLNNPKNYEEACKAMKILKPEITESEMKAAWAKRNK